MSAVYFVQGAGRGNAFWRASDESADVFLCAVALDVYDSESEVRDRFAELVNAVAAHCRRRLTAEVADPASRLAGLPCEKCEAPEADDVRHPAGQVSDVAELELSPGGFPVGCCKRRVVGAFGGRPDTPRPATGWSR
jgi:hypothetical protein